MEAPKKNGWVPLFFTRQEFAQEGARCDEHCQHFKKKNCWVALCGSNYKMAEQCSEYKPINTVEKKA